MEYFCQNALAFGSGLFRPHCLNSKANAIVEICAEPQTEIYYLCDVCSSKLTAKARGKNLRAKVEYVELNNKTYKKITITLDQQTI